MPSSLQQQYEAFCRGQKPWLPPAVQPAPAFSGPTPSHSFAGPSTEARQSLPQSAGNAPMRPAPVPRLGSWAAAPMRSAQGSAFVPAFASADELAAAHTGVGGWTVGMHWGSSATPGPATIDCQGDALGKLQPQPTPPPGLAPSRSATSLSNDSWSPRPSSPEPVPTDPATDLATDPATGPPQAVVSEDEPEHASISEDGAMVSPTVFDEESDLSTDAESEGDSDDDDSGDESSSADEEHKKSAHLAALAADTRQMYGRASGRRAAVDRPWTDEECVQLAVLVQDEGEGSWTMIARKIGSRRTAAACEVQYKLLTNPSPTAKAAAEGKRKHRKKKDEDDAAEPMLSEAERAALYHLPDDVMSGSVAPMINAGGEGAPPRFPKRMLTNFKVGQLPKERVIQTWNSEAQECFWKLRVDYWTRQKVRKCKKSCPERGLRAEGDVHTVRRRLCMSEFKRSGLLPDEILNEADLRFWADSASESESEESDESEEEEEEEEESESEAEVGQCEKNPFCTRGYHHRGNGGQCNGQRERSDDGGRGGGMSLEEEQAEDRAAAVTFGFSSAAASARGVDASSVTQVPVGIESSAVSAGVQPRLLKQPEQPAAAAAAHPNGPSQYRSRRSKHSIYRGLCWRKNSNKWQVEIRNRYLGRYAPQHKMISLSFVLCAIVCRSDNLRLSVARLYRPVLYPTIQRVCT